jgi:UDP-glucose 4-epimerase
MSRRSVLLTGGAGFIGSHLAHALLADGWSVDIVDDLTTGNPANVADGAALHELDLTQPDALDRLPGESYDAILHLAGQSSGEKSFDDPVHDHDANARSTLLLADWALRRGIPAFLQASSMGVYGQPEDHPVSEKVEPAPLSWYGTSKLAAEHALAMASREGLQACSLRMFSVYGPGQDLAEMRQGMASIYLAFVLRGEPIVVKGSLDRVRDFIYIDDCVEAWRLALERGATGIFNLGSGTGTTVRQLVEQLLVATEAPTDYPVIEDDGTPGDQFALSADVTRLRTELGWQPRTALPDGIAALVAWARGAG